MMPDSPLQQTVRGLPSSSGVYLMKDIRGKVVYVGKAVDVRKRVQSYFRRRSGRSRTDLLVEAIADIECRPTSSEAEALILEAFLIKQYQPKYNVDLRDDKSYPLIEISPEVFPRVAVVRPRRRNPEAVYYGPYTQPRLIREALNIIRRIFPFRTCDPFPSRECLDFHLGLCKAPCIGNQSRADYGRTIRHIRMILEGRRDQLYRQLSREMEKAARARDFETAAAVRDQIRAVGALYSGTQDMNYFKEAEQLQRALRLPCLPEKIEAFDISNTLGCQSVGSMAAFFNGKPEKASYRRFKIQTVQGIDDVQMIAEVVRRRYSRLKRENRPFPDLILIDGGKGQLSAACRALEAVEVEIPVVSLAKRAEEIFVPGRRAPVILPRESLALRLLQRCRDEAHRFALAYHRKLRAGQALMPGEPRVSGAVKEANHDD